MNLKTLLEKIFLGETLVEKISSPVNGEIKIYDSWFGRSMRVGGATQSGGLVEKLWKKIFNLKFEIFNQNRNLKFLILGLGAGTVAKLISERFPTAKIVGVEIDPVVVEMGKKYFKLEEIKNLEIVVADAIRRVQSAKIKVQNSGQSSKFDLILIDIYRGKEYPEEAESEEFINGVKDLLDEGGMAIFNRLSYGKYNQSAIEFSEKLRLYFPKVFTKRAVTNLLIFCSQ